MIKVGLDISQLAHRGGVGVTVGHVAELLSQNSKLQMKFLYYSLRRSYRGPLKNVKSLPIPPTLAEPLFNVLRLSVDRFIGEVDIYHSSDWIQPKTKAKKVTTYYDLVPILYPEWSVKSIVKVHQRRLKLVEKEIDLVIAISQSTKADLLKVSSLAADKIVVIPLAADSQFKPQDPKLVAQFKLKYQLPDKFILAIGGVGKRRNLNRVKSISHDYPVLITQQDLQIPQTELPLLYNSARLLLYPSYYEGFGLPILEAFACGVPVITSNVSAMAEIGQGAARLVDPNNLDEITRAVREVFEAESLRAEMIKRGLAKAALYSWEKTTNLTVAAYERLYGS